MWALSRHRTSFWGVRRSPHSNGATSLPTTLPDSPPNEITGNFRKCGHNFKKTQIQHTPPAPGYLLKFISSTNGAGSWILKKWEAFCCSKAGGEAKLFIEQSIHEAAAFYGKFGHVQNATHGTDCIRTGVGLYGTQRVDSPRPTPGFGVASKEASHRYPPQYTGFQATKSTTPLQKCGHGIIFIIHHDQSPPT